MAFTVLTVNVHKGFTSFNRRFMLHELREAVREVSADIVFLQEVLGTHERHASRVANFPAQPHYEFLADSIWSQYAYGRNAVYDKGHHGNALLSKFPIMHFENHDISVSGPERRGMLHCVLQPPTLAMPVHAICVHLGLQEAHRHRQLHRLAALVRSLPEGDPVVVAGDFNDWGLQIKRMLAGFGLFEYDESPQAYTYPARLPMVQLDHVYVRGLRPLSLQVPRGRIWWRMSDHLPLIAEFQL